MFWRKDKGKDTKDPKDSKDKPTNNDSHNSKEKTENAAPPPPPESTSTQSTTSIPSAGTTESKKSLRISMAPVRALGRWSYRAQQNNKPKIAFMPERGVTEEMLALQEELEKKSARKSHVPHHHPKKSEADTLLAQKQKETLQKQPGGSGSGSAGASTSADKKNNYDFLPRPFKQHMKDLKKRRARKLVEAMNSPAEVYATSEKDKRVKFAPHGTLIFHILELINLSVNDSSFVGSLPLSFYCIMSIGSLKRTTKIVHARTAKRIRVDYTAHFSIEVPEWRESNLNRFIVELWSYQDPEMHYIVGSMELHAYEFVRNQHAVDRFQLFSDGIKVGKIYCEYAFSYGYFGYGHSNYLKNPNNPIMETACHSMYPRIRIDPDADLVDKVYHIRLPQQLKVFTFNSLILEFRDAIELTSSRNKRLEDNPTKPITVQQVSFEDDKPIHCKLHMNIYQKEVQPDFNDTFGEYICFGSRKTRLDYLGNLTTGRMRDLYEDDYAGIMFLPFKDTREAERVQNAEINHPGYLVYPTKLACVTSLGSQALTQEDESFLSSFPSLRRTQGYLSGLFGYEKGPPPEGYLNDMDAPLYKDADTRKKRRFNCCRCLRLFFLHIAACFNRIFNFIFPEVRRPPPVPEISVTTPTPQSSTTKVYTYFAKESKDLGATKLDRLQAQTAALVQLSEHRRHDRDEDSDISSSSGTEEDTIQSRQAESLRRGHQLPTATNINKPKPR